MTITTDLERADNMREEFELWMKKQKQSNGKDYMKNTITAYAGQLKNATPKLNLLGGAVHTNLFSYASFDEFEKIRQIILAAPNFKEVDRKAQNGAYSSGIKMYASFLKEREISRTSISPTKRRYWLYSPGRNAQQWEEFYRDGIMGIGWGKSGDLSVFKTKEDLKAALINDNGSAHDYLWQFAKEMSVDDVVFAKRGKGNILGCGTVVSNYIYEKSRGEYRHIHKVNWTHQGKWEIPDPHKAQTETLTDITPYPDYVKKLESLFIGDKDTYTETDFLDEVYISAEQYATLKGLLRRKKNLILQGAPGVGKTFAARRLAFSIMGEKDTSRVKTVQFHQSYSYEDFVMGYRPDGQGFQLAHGPFYEFCKRATDDEERDYFFIIDEINRGNLSKIFGELLMLIEDDKRGEQHAIRLLYENELFSVPANVHIIGMMNTADRSLAMIDYALRRRFAFFDMEPAFESDGFKRRQEKLQNEKFNALVNKVKELNAYIAKDDSLGPGFRIGHSYFCLDGTVDDACLYSIIQYEIVPLLNEYWFDEQSKLQEWTGKLHGVMRGE